ncbi:MAG: hypothetical protein M3X11_13530 [Acidobacteriota bacterium]|nr:hypothetical protein [Acidobacteriota bacterium]
MHDCRKTKKNLVDLVFGEYKAGQQQEGLAEIRSCPSCSQEYQSMLATLRVFDQAADAVMPEESYWIGYEARLRTRLAEPVAPNRQERLAALFAWLLAKPAIPLALAAGLILIATISTAWFSRQGVGNPPVLVVKTTPTPQPSPTGMTSEQTGAAQTEIQSEQRLVVAANSRQPRQHRQPGTGAKLTVSAPEELIATNLLFRGTTRPLPSDVLPVAVSASHFEKAQLLLRSFRNARDQGKSAAIDVAYEKRQAGKLVYDNILLRRDAEAKGNLPVEEALNSLEPLLLDIANLSDKPSRGEVQVIRERIQKQEIIATLQITSFGTERFSPPALLNP